MPDRSAAPSAGRTEVETGARTTAHGSAARPRARHGRTGRAAVAPPGGGFAPAPRPAGPLAARLAGWRRRPAGRGGEVLLRGALAGGAAVAAARLHSWHDPGVLCPLRLVAGLPCPACGSTTFLVELGRGNWSAALLANPVTALAASAAVAAPAVPPGRWPAVPVVSRWALLAVALAVAWAWQLWRIGIGRP
ncbi:DUF2752 domain-containing protein [Allostreptomyces psammosilenae]|uniref:DUF2752 domain-containing protein n=1 Tax=Allostreptomyces psammosilenae TaxID=1892865 RepID=A0A853A059_9ACTN|nr:DUF2752 domain-containing protein [Allostreptomyces psammosilenae]NYI07966.1 hypothetical protein [Allostreptomyces psammosilenae]